MVLSRSYSLYFGEHFLLWVLYSSLSLWFKYSLYSHTFIVRICNHAVLSLFILGERTGSLLGIISLYISDFYILIFSHPSYSWFPCLILLHTAFLSGVSSVCVHHDSVFCVCTLFFFTSFLFLFLMHTSCVFFLCIHACTPMCYIIPRHPFGGLYIWRAIYIWRDIIYLEGSICFEGS